MGSSVVLQAKRLRAKKRRAKRLMGFFMIEGLKD
jgi:hypothetical protein